MAFDLTNNQVAVAIRVSTDPNTDPPVAIKTALDCLIAAGKERIMRYAPTAPTAINDAALIRLVGFLYDAEAGDPRNTDPLMSSGAAALLSPWRFHGIGILEESGAAAVIEPGSGLPPLPVEGSYVLSAENGELAWLAFPLPPTS